MSSPTTDWIQVFKKENKDEDLVSLLLIEDYIGISTFTSESEIGTIPSPPYIGIGDGNSLKSNVYTTENQVLERTVMETTSILEDVTNAQPPRSDDTDIVEEGLLFTKSDIDHIVDSLFEHKISLEDCMYQFEVTSDEAVSSSRENTSTDSSTKDPVVSVRSLKLVPSIDKPSSIPPSPVSTDEGDRLPENATEDPAQKSSSETSFPDYTNLQISLDWWYEQLLPHDWVEEVWNSYEDSKVFLQRNEQYIRQTGFYIGAYILIPVMLHYLLTTHSSTPPVSSSFDVIPAHSIQMAPEALCYHDLTKRTSLRQVVRLTDHCTNLSTKHNMSQIDLAVDNQTMKQLYSDVAPRAGTFSRLASQLFTKSKQLLCDSISVHSIHRQGRKFNQYCGKFDHQVTSPQVLDSALLAVSKQSEILHRPLLPKPINRVETATASSATRNQVLLDQDMNDDKQLQLWRMHSVSDARLPFDTSSQMHTSKFLTSTFLTASTVFAYEKLLLLHLRSLLQQVLFVHTPQALLELQKALVVFAHNPCIGQVVENLRFASSVVGSNLSLVAHSTALVTSESVRLSMQLLEQAMVLLSPQLILSRCLQIIEIEGAHMAILGSVAGMENMTLGVAKEFDNAVGFLVSAGKKLVDESSVLWASSCLAIAHVAEELMYDSPVLEAYSVFIPTF